MEDVVFIDFEASSLSPLSWPIEVGLAWLEGRRVIIESKLIRPHPSWPEDDWNPESEAVHNIPRSDLDEAEPAEEVAAWLLEIVGDRVLVSDAPEFDQRWLNRLLGQPGPEIADFDSVLRAAFSQEDGVVAPGRLHKAYKSRRTRKNTHRAGQDVANLAYTYRAGLPDLRKFKGRLRASDRLTRDEANEQAMKEFTFISELRAREERVRPIMEERSRKLRILHDLVCDRFDGAYSNFLSYSSRVDSKSIAYFYVIHDDVGIRFSAVNFIEEALQIIDIPKIAQHGSDAFSVYLRPEPASQHEKIAMMKKLNEGDHKMTLDKLRQEIIDGRPGLQDYLDKTETKKNLALELMAARKRAGLDREVISIRSGLPYSLVEEMESPSGDMPSEETIQRYLDACK